METETSNNVEHFKEVSMENSINDRGFHHWLVKAYLLLMMAVCVVVASQPGTLFYEHLGAKVSIFLSSFEVVAFIAIFCLYRKLVDIEKCLK